MNINAGLVIMELATHFTPPVTGKSVSNQKVQKDQRYQQYMRQDALHLYRLFQQISSDI